jgi:hypothetical protein
MSSKLNVKLPDFLHVQDDEVRLAGHRLSIVDILAPYRDGYTPEMLAAVRHDFAGADSLRHRVLPRKSDPG